MNAPRDAERAGLIFQVGAQRTVARQQQVHVVAPRGHRREGPQQHGVIFHRVKAGDSDDVTAGRGPAAGAGGRPPRGGAAPARPPYILLPYTTAPPPGTPPPRPGPPP